MSESTRDRLLDYLAEHSPATGPELCRHLGITRQALSQQLRPLIVSGDVVKSGSTRAARYYATDQAPGAPSRPGTSTQSRGRCLCGAIRLEAVGEPRWVAYCHCASCRRHTGSPVTCFVNYRKRNVTFSREPAVFESSAGVGRRFCKRCGTPIAYETDRRADEIDIYLNVLDEPERFVPEAHAFYSERLPWFGTHDDLPKKG